MPSDRRKAASAWVKLRRLILPSSGAVRATYLLEEQPGGVFHYHDTPSSKELLKPPGTGCPGNRAPKTATERMRANRIKTAHQNRRNVLLQCRWKVRKVGKNNRIIFDDDDEDPDAKQPWQPPKQESKDDNDIKSVKVKQDFRCQVRATNKLDQRHS